MFDQLDLPFTLALTHRLRTRRGLFDNPSTAFSGLLPLDAPNARALTFIDAGLVGANPALPPKVDAAIEAAGLVRRAAAVIVPGGEAVKNDRRILDAILHAIHDAGLCRRSYVIAVGGGAVLDAVGFAAATAHRGVRLVRIPTTTLAQADSCVAVKCGVNAFGKKNYLGCFAAPWAVILDPTLLKTLPDRDWRAGFSEVLKVGLIKDAALFHDLRAAVQRIAARHLDTAWPLIARSAELHLRHITSGGDPFELAEARPLDFGHWAAHRLEALTAHRLRHGEAVAIGIAIDTEYARRSGLIADADAEAVLATLEALGFALADPALDEPEPLLAGLDEFREHLGGRLTITLLLAPGRGIDVHEIDLPRMRDAITSIRARAASPVPSALEAA